MNIKIIENLVIASILLIVLALVYTQTIKGQYYYHLSVNNRIRVIPFEGPRGMITDRQGTVLAENRLACHVAIISQDIDDTDSLFLFLGDLLKKDPALLRKKFLQKRRTPFEPVILAEDVDQRTVFVVQENRFKYPGLVIEKTYERHYPFGKSDAHAVGYVGKVDPNEADVLGEYGYSLLSLIGKAGVEKSYDPVLRPEAGGRQIEINSRGKEVRLLGLKDPVKGKDIQLTIDQRIQSLADELLDSRRGAVVVMDLSNGEVLGLVSSPSFDPNVFSDKNRQNELVSYMRDPNASLLNRVVAGRFPPGSVFKIPVALGALETARINPELTYECPGYYLLGKSAKFGCAHIHGSENLNQAIAHSCNVYFYHLGLKLGPKVILQYARAFGLGRITGIDLPSEYPGHLVGGAEQHRPWFPGNTLNFSIGQGDTLSTPLQLALMISAVANDGLILRPHIVKSVDHTPIKQLPLEKLPIIRIHDRSWRIVQQGLRSVVTDEQGTAHLLNDLAGMTIYGKTGTAQAGKDKANHAWFVGYLRSSKSNLAFSVFLENGGSSANAVELTHELLKRMQAQGIV